MLYRELHRDGVLLPLFREFMQRPSEHVNVPEATHLIDQWITPEKRRRNASELQLYVAGGCSGLRAVISSRERGGLEVGRAASRF